MNEALTLGIAVDAAPAETGATKVVTAYHAIEVRADAMTAAVGRADAAMAKMGRAANFDAVTQKIATGAAGVDAMAAAMERAERVEKLMMQAMTGMADASAKQTAAIEKMNAALEKLLNTRKGYNDVPKPKPVVDETEEAALDRLTQRIKAAREARERDAQSAQTQKQAQDTLNASVYQGASTLQVSNAGLLAAAKAADSAKSSIDRLAKARKDEEAASNAMVKSADALLGRYAPMIKAQEQLAADRAAFAKVQKEGTLTADQEAAVMAGLTSRTQMLEAAQKSLSGTMKLSHNNSLALNAAFINFGQSLAAGMNPMTALVTQIGQAAPAFGEMAIKAGTSGTAIAAIAAPAIAVTAILAAGVISYERYIGSLRDFDRANRLAGNSVGLTRDQMAAYAETVAAASGVSDSFARSTITAYTSLGGIGTPVMSSLIGLTKDYAAVTGESADDAAKALAALFKDPAKGADELAAKIGLLSGAQLDYIRRLADSRQTTQAQTVLIEALGQRIRGAAQETSVWARAWDAVATGASNAASAVGRAIDRAVNGPSLSQRIEEARNYLEDLNKRNNEALFPDLEKQRNAPEMERTRKLLAELYEMDRERNRLSATQARDAQNNSASRAALDVANAYNDVGGALRKANADLAILQKGLGTNMGYAAGAAGVAVEGLKNQIADLTKVQASGLDLSTYKTRELANVELRAAGMVGPAKDKYLAQERARIEAFGTATTQAQRNVTVQTAVTQATAATTSAIASANAQLSLSAQYTLASAEAYLKAGEAAGAYAEALRQAKQDELSTGVNADARAKQLMAEKAAQTALAGAQQVPGLEREAEARQKVAAAAMQGVQAQQQAELAYKIEQATLQERLALVNANAETEAILLDVIARKTAAITEEDAAARKLAAAGMLQQQRDQLAVGRQQLDLMWASAEARALEMARTQALIDLRNRNIEATSAEGAAYLANAEALARQGLEIDRASQAYQELERFGDQALSSVIDATVKGEGATRSWSKTIKGLAAEFETLALRMLAINPIKNAVFGTNLATFGTFIGGSPSGTGAAGQGSMGGVGDYLSLGSKFMPSSWMNGALNGAASALGIGGASVAAQGAAASTIAEVAAADVMAAWGAGGSGIAAGSGASAGAASTLAAGAGDAAMAAGGGLTAGGATLASVLGPAAAGFGIGMLPGMFGANKATSAGIGALGGAGAGFLIGGPVGALIGGGAGLLGGLLGGQTKPSNMEGNLAIDFATGKVTPGGQTGDKFSQQNRDAASALGGEVQKLAVALEALLPGQQIKGSGLIAVGNRDGLRAEYGAQKAEFGKEDTAGLAQWFAKQFATDMKTGFERDDVPKQVASNLQIVLDKGITGSVEQFVADMQLAATDFAKAFDSIGKAQPDQIAADMAVLSQSFITTRDRAKTLGFATVGLVESFDSATDRMVKSASYAANGIPVSAVQTIKATFDSLAMSLLAAGRSAQPAIDLYGVQMVQAMKAVGDDIGAVDTLHKLADAIRGTDAVAASFAEERARQVAAKVSEDLTLRQMQAQVQLGQVSQDAYDLAALEVQQKRELALVTDTALKAQLAQVQATERQAVASKAAAAAAEKAAEAQKAFASASTTTRSYLLSLLTGEAGGLSAQDRYRNAQGEYASASAAIGPQATAEQLQRQTEAAKAFLDASRAMNGSTTDYFRDLSSVTADLAKSAQLTPDDPVVTAINALKASVDGLGGKVNVQVSVDAINFVRGEIEQTIKTYVSTAGLTDREVQLANGLLADVQQSVTVALSPITGMTARELQVYQGALSNLDQSITAAVDTSALTGANREIALGQLSDATRTINAALGQFPSLSAEQREFVLGASRDFSRTANGVFGAMPNLSAEQQAILLGQSGSFERTFNSLAGAAPSLSAEQAAILSGVSDSFSRTFNGLVGALPTMTGDQRAILLGVSDSFTRMYQQAVGALPSMSAEQQAILSGITGSFTKTFQSAASALPSLSADQLSILRGKTDDFTRTFIAATNDLVLTDDEKAVLAAKDANIRQTLNQFVNRDVNETVTSTAMRDLTTGFATIQLQTTSMQINQLDALGRIMLQGFANVVRAVSGNWDWGKAEIDAALSAARPNVLNTGAANYLARYTDVADWWVMKPSNDVWQHYLDNGARENRIWEPGKVVGAYADGGVVGNGIRGVDSVMARYAGGGYIGLAGGEYVTPTAGVTGETKPMLDYIRQNRSLPSSPMRPVVMPAANSNRASSTGEMVSELRALRKEVAALRRENTTMIQKQALMEDAGLQAQTAAITTAITRAKSKQAASAA